jgi:magnesium chelatase subunit I
LNWFLAADAFELSDEASETTYTSALLSVTPLVQLLKKYQPNVAPADIPFLLEFILWALVELKQLSKKRTADGLVFNDTFDHLLKGF